MPDAPSRRAEDLGKPVVVVPLQTVLLKSEDTAGKITGAGDITASAAIKLALVYSLMKSLF